MEHKKNKVDLLAITRNMEDLNRPTGNIYETVNILAKRASQISKEVKEELTSKIIEFAAPSDNLEEVFENREQIEIAKHYEHLPKASLVATTEFLNGNVYFRNPVKEISPDQF